MDVDAGTSAGGASSSAHKDVLKTAFGLQRSFEPLYTGGATTAVTSDGQFLFAPVNDVIQCTNTLTGRIVARIPSDLEEVTAVTLSPDQATLVVASRSLALRVFALRFVHAEDAEPKANAETVVAEQSEDKEEASASVRWTLQRTIAKTHDAPVVVMRIDPTSTLIATGSSDTCAKVWDLKGGFCTHVFRGHGGIVSSLAWNMAQGRIELFSGSIDGRIRRWDLKAAASKPQDVLETHFSVVRGLDVSKKGDRVISAGRDRMVAMWERKSAKKQQSWALLDTVTASESLESAGFLDDGGKTFWTAGAEGEIRLWDFDRRGPFKLQPNGRFERGLVTKKAVAQDDDEQDGSDENETRAVTEVHWLPEQKVLVTIHADQEIIFRSSVSLKRIRQLAGFTDQIIDGVLLSTDGGADSHLAVATNSTTIRVYNLSAKQYSVDVLPSEHDLGSSGDDSAQEGHSGLILCLDKTADGRWLASGGKDRQVRIWAYVPQRAEDKMNAGAADDDEVGVAVDANGAEKGGKEADMGWSCVAVAKGHTESIGALAFARRPQSANGSGAPFLVSGSQDRTAKVWDLSGLEKHIAKHFSASSSQRKPLALQSLCTLKIHEKDVNTLDVSPNNALLLTGSQDRTAKVFSIQYAAPSKANGQTASCSLSHVKTCQGHKRGVWSVAFSPNDAVFLTASSDRTMKLWSINDGFTCVKNYVGHTNSVLRVRFLRNTNGLQCISCASDGLVKVWNVRTEECVCTLDGHEERVWALDCTRKGDMLVSGAADGMIRFWHDETVQRATEQFVERQRAVEQEQAFGNLLAVKDYRNAISLALAMQQPRRLLDLFTAVDQQRSHSQSQRQASDATAALLDQAIQQSSTTRLRRDPALAEVLTRAGVLPSSASAVRKRQGAKESDEAKEEASITGSKAVDEVIATLKPAQLVALLTFVRDWNTSVRTSTVAQTVLHAILRFHSADAIIRAFEGAQKGKNDGGEEDATAQPPQQRRRRRGDEAVDLGNILQALMPYTQRHYDRAQRVLTESAMLDYTLANMDAILGVDEEEEKDSDVEMNGDGHVATNGHRDPDSSEEDDDEDDSE